MVYLNNTNTDINFKMRKSNIDLNNFINLLKPTDFVIEEYNNQYQEKEMTINGLDYRNINFKKFVKQNLEKKILI